MLVIKLTRAQRCSLAFLVFVVCALRHTQLRIALVLIFCFTGTTMHILFKSSEAAQELASKDKTGMVGLLRLNLSL